MREKTKRRIAVLLFMLAVVVGPPLACGKAGCYSQFPGCEATAEALSTAAAHGE